MYGQEKHRSPRNITLIMDWVHILFGILIVLMGIFAFLNPQKNMFLFPFIFLLAAVMNLINGIHHYRQGGRQKRKKAAAIGQLVIAAALLSVAIVSAVSIWR